MKKTAKRSSRKRQRWITGALFALAAALLAFGAAGTSRAALTYISDYYTAQIGMYDIGVTLVENGEDISWRNYSGGDDVWYENTGKLVEHMLGENESLQPGKPYAEELCVRNSGNIDEYVRVMLYRYWEDKDGKKTELAPELIDLNLINEGTWLVDESACTPERTVLYYKDILKAGETSVFLSDWLSIDRSVADKVKVTETRKGSQRKITAAYEYGEYKFVLEAEVDAVQTHNAADAIKSAWGVDVAVNADGSIHLR